MSKDGSQNDVTAAILSSLGVIVQLLLFIITTIASSIKALDLFILQDFIPFVTLIAVFLGLSFAGLYSFLHKNKPFFSNPSFLKPIIWLKSIIYSKEGQQSVWGDSVKLERRFMVGSFSVLVISILLFLTSTTVHLNKSAILFFTTASVPLLQTISYLFMWVSTSAVLFVWLISEREKSQQFKEEDFIKNLYVALREQGYLSVTVKEVRTVSTEYGKKYVVVEMNKAQSPERFFVCSFDGKIISQEIEDKKEYQKIFKPLKKTRPQSVPSVSVSPSAPL